MTRRLHLVFMLLVLPFSLFASDRTNNNNVLAIDVNSFDRLAKSFCNRILHLKKELYALEEEAAERAAKRIEEKERQERKRRDYEDYRHVFYNLPGIRGKSAEKNLIRKYLNLRKCEDDPFPARTRAIVNEFAQETTSNKEQMIAALEKEKGQR